MRDDASRHQPRKSDRSAVPSFAPRPSPPRAPPADGAAPVILIRTTSLDAETVAFGQALGHASGRPTAFLVDERKGPVSVADSFGPVGKVSLTIGACRGLGLYCPPDFAWRCGDYGLYVARHQHPDVEHFWMIESDVRFLGGDIAGFFDFFARIEADLLAGQIQAATPDWYWSHHASARDCAPFRCFFPVTRFSARALDVLLAKRVEHSRRLTRRLLWPNDEAFVATTLHAAGLICRDFNDFGRSFYDLKSFSFENVIDGHAFTAEAPELRMYHPVLFGEAYARKLERLNAPRNLDTPTKRRIRRVLSEINRRTAW